MGSIPTYLLCGLIGYLLGSISTGILVTSHEGHDIRSEGSRNTGASNALRVLGIKAGLVVFWGDFFKAAIAIVLGSLIAGRFGGMAAGFGAVLGHNWPLYFSFKGGKGVACSAALLLLLFPWQGGIALAACLIVIALTKYISVGSLTALTVFFFLLLFTEAFFPCAVWALILLLLSVYRHRSNLVRLKNGTENKIGKRVKS